MSSSYLAHTCRGNIREKVAVAVRELGKRRDEFRCIVVRGLSGVTVGSIVAHLLDKDLVVVRKEHERCHGLDVEGPWEWEKSPYILLDDFICYGSTLQAMLEKAPNPVYVYLYNGDNSTSRSYYDTLQQRTVWEIIVHPEDEGQRLYTLHRPVCEPQQGEVNASGSTEADRLEAGI